jgi:ATP-dependent DNA ligase
VDVPFQWPLPPMLGKLVRSLPAGDLLYEPKWDGFRCVAARAGDEVDLRSRHGNALGRYFPELVNGMRSVRAARFVVDGEIVAPGAVFADLMARLHPAASRVDLLRRETPTRFVAFDLLAVGDESLLELPFGQRRERLERLLGDAPPPLSVTPATDDATIAAEWVDRFEGVLAKPLGGVYEPGKRALLKVKRERTADCVVAGFRWRLDRPLPSSLLLGLYDDVGALHHVGVASSFGVRDAARLLEELRPHVAPLERHPWEHGFLLGGGPTGRLRGAAGRWTPEMTMDWTPLEPALVAEVTYDQVDVDRFRHPSRFRRWRRDRDPRSCTFAQLEVDSPPLELLLPHA